MPWDNLSNSGWNILFSAFPVVVMGLFDQPVSPRALIAFPKLYAAGQRNTYVLFLLQPFFLKKLEH